MTTPTLNLPHLRELLDAATPRPWAIASDLAGTAPPNWVVLGDTLVKTKSMVVPTKEDAAVIVALRNSAPAMLDWIENAAKALEIIHKEKGYLSCVRSPNCSHCLARQLLSQLSAPEKGERDED